jgi:cytochrome bd-type quinol oxidase subunit 2
MVEIVGFIGCALLLLKGVEFLASGAYRNEEARLRLVAKIAAALCFISSIVFAGWLFIQSHHVRMRQASSASKEFPDDFPDDFPKSDKF